MKKEKKKKKKSHLRILRREPKEQHLSIIFKLCPVYIYREREREMVLFTFLVSQHLLFLSDLIFCILLHFKNKIKS